LLKKLELRLRLKCERLEKFVLSSGKLFQILLPGKQKSCALSSKYNLGEKVCIDVHGSWYHCAIRSNLLTSYLYVNIKSERSMSTFKTISFNLANL